MSWITLLVLPLVGGYAFSITWSASLYRSARESGQRLYFRAVFYGIFLTLCSALIHVYLFCNQSMYYHEFLSLINSFNSNQNQLSLNNSLSQTTVLFGAFILGPVIGQILNIPKIPFIRHYWLFYAWEKMLLKRAIATNDFELLILRATDTNFPLLISMQSGKIYIGYSVRAPNPTEERKALRILPFASGHRDPRTHKLVITTNYHNVLTIADDEEIDALNHLSSCDFEIVIPSDQICSANLFDFTAYIEYFKDDAIEEQKLKRPYRRTLSRRAD